MKNTAYFCIVAISIVTALIYGKSLLIPFIFALLLWFLSRKLRLTFNRIKFVNNFFPSWMKNTVSSLVILSLLVVISKILTSNINTLASASQNYDTNIGSIIESLSLYLSVDLVETLKVQLGNINFGNILSLIFNSLTELFGNLFMIIIYVLFIFLEEVNFHKKLLLAFSTKNKQDKISTVIDEIEASVTNYLGLKTLVSLSTGFLSYLVLLFIGIDAPIFWAFLITLLNYIPTIGSLIATVFPATYCLLQFGELYPFVLVLILVGLIQIIIGNILEPRLMGNSLNISSLATLITLSIWGSIWGITGMFLSVPISVILIIILSQFPSTRPVAIMLSDKGEIN
ncbi:MAG: AI-2E family transporter [Bacteroidota bacterium]|nr:AI-2E family transporter [Bacteroidota bacterium]MEC8968847.1 AI-2E family transporter [Bacteroidota bacterium]